MGRVIQFRAYDTFNQRMISDPYMFEPTAEHHNETAPFIYYETWRDVEDGIYRPCYIMQFCELMDIEGKEVFEGDVFDYGFNRIFYITYKAPSFIPTFINGETNSMIPIRQFKIIGNIYENPELLTND